MDMTLILISVITVFWTALIQFLLWRDKRISGKGRPADAIESEVEDFTGLDTPTGAAKQRYNDEVVSIVPVETHAPTK